jgi:hypothetical protein
MSLIFLRFCGVEISGTTDFSEVARMGNGAIATNRVQLVFYKMNYGSMAVRLQSNQ